MHLRSWIIWLTASLFYLFEFIHRTAISVMLPELAASFNASIFALGSLSASYFFAYAAAQIPVGLLIDRFGTRALLSLACLLIALSSFAFSSISNIVFADVFRMLIGFGSAFAFVSCLKLASVWFPARKYAFIIGLTNLFGVMGAIIGGRPIAHSVEIYGWRPVMFMSGIVGIILAVLLWTIVRDSKQQQHKHRIYLNLNDFWQRLIATLKTKQIWIIAAFGGFMVAPIVTYAELWGVSFLMDTYNLNRPTAAHISTLTFIGIAIGGPIIGFISDNIGQRKLPMLIGLIGAMVSVSTILLVSNLFIAALYILHICFGFFSSSMLLCFSLSSEATINKIRATTIALTNSIIMIMSALLQEISGFLLDHSHSNYTVGLTPIILCYGLAFICYLFIHETKCKFKDEERVCS